MCPRVRALDVREPSPVRPAGVVRPADMSACPRDGTPLSLGAGALGEGVCAGCQGRFLDSETAHRLFVDVMKIPQAVLHELALDGPTLLTCPACATKLTATWARGVQVDLCRGCGGCWLDRGELARLGKDIVKEVEVARAPASDNASGSWGGELELATRAAPPSSNVRFHVLCMNCDRPLDLTQTNWLVNTRPWCPECAGPYTSLFSGVLSPFVLVAQLILGGMGRRGHGWRTPAMDPGLNKTADVLRIKPEDAEKYFGAFFVRVPEGR